MRILAVTPYYQPEGGGLERYAHETLHRLAARGHVVEAISFTREGLEDGHRDGVWVDRRSPRLTVGNTPVDPRFIGDVRDAIARFDPDVAVGHTPVPFPAEMGFLAANAEDVPFVSTYHAGRLRGSSPLLEVVAAVDRATIQRAMLSGSERLIGVSEFVRDNALAHEDRATVISPGVDSDVFSPGGRTDRRTILFIGPISTSYRWKGLDTLCEAFERVRKREPDARLEIVGTGDRTDEIRRWGRQVGGVELLGRLSEDALVAAYRRAAVAVLPSTTDAESFGMVLAEANACGTPVVASRVGGVPCFVRDGHNGLLAEPGDAGELADGILTLLSSPGEAQRMGKRGRRLVEREHDWDNIASQTEAVLSQAAGVATTVIPEDSRGTDR